MTMLPVTISMAATNAHATLGGQEMESIALVRQEAGGQLVQKLQLPFHLSDVDECQSDICDINAFCTDTIGSYFCTCITGYEGNGHNCSSR